MLTILFLQNQFLYRYNTISLMHYNTFQEVEKLVEILKYFNKKQMDFDFSVTYNLKNKISNVIKNSFNNMT